MIKVGQRVKYDPFKAMSYLGVCEVRQVVTGVVTYINHKRGWFTVEKQRHSNHLPLYRYR